MQKLSQETIAIIGVGVALAAIVIASVAGLRDDLRVVQAEARAGQEAIRAESQEAREAIRKESQEAREAVRKESREAREAIRAESREAREAVRKESQESVAAIRAESRADREAFAKALLRLTEQYGVLHGLVQGLLRAQGMETDETAPAEEPGR